MPPLCLCCFYGRTIHRTNFNVGLCSARFLSLVRRLCAEVPPAQGKTPLREKLFERECFQIRNCLGAPTGGAPLFDRRLTLKNHARIFAQRPAKASFFGAKFHAGARVRRAFGAAGQDGCAAFGDSSVNGAGVVLVVVRENLLIRGRSLVV